MRRPNVANFWILTGIIASLALALVLNGSIKVVGVKIQDDVFIG